MYMYMYIMYLTFVPLSLWIRLVECPGMGTDFLVLLVRDVDMNGVEPGHIYTCTCIIIVILIITHFDKLGIHILYIHVL